MVFQTRARSNHVPDQVVMTNGWYVVSVMAPKISPNYKGWSPCINWCLEQFGRHIMDDWGYLGGGVFEVRKENHAAWFMLRWQ